MSHFVQQTVQGSSFMFKGLRLAWQPGIRPWVLIPLLSNFLVFIAVTIWAWNVASEWLATWLSWIPSWLDFITGLITIFLMGIWLFIYSFIYVMLGNLIAAPFNGLLSEKVEAHLTRRQLPDFSWRKLPPLILRTVKRELQKLLYFLPRALGIGLLCFVLSFVPALNLAVPVIAFLWGSWWLAIQYIDYPLDNRGTPFGQLRRQLRQQSGQGYGFGALALAASMVPVLNIIAMPVAVIGGTALWLEKLEPQAAKKN